VLLAPHQLFQAQLVLKDLQVLRVLRANQLLDLLVHVVQPAHKVFLVNKVLQVQQALQVQLVHKEQLDLQVQQALEVYRD
jgi:hypothetical protein